MKLDKFIFLNNKIKKKYFTRIKLKKIKYYKDHNGYFLFFYIYDSQNYSLKLLLKYSYI